MAADMMQPTPSSAPSAPRRGLGIWFWLVALFMVTVVAPILACGAFGYAFAVGSTQPSAGWGGIGGAVGVVRVEGMIVSGRSLSVSMSVAPSELVIDQIRRAQDDPTIRAVVLRIDSPGGDAVASDEIYHALRQLDKPVVVSMGSLAASGGYYIAAAADYIYAAPTTLTASIGVISEFVIAEDLLDKLGVQVVVVESGEVKDFGGFYRQMTEEERAYWQGIINETHDRFVQVVVEGRGLDEETVRAIADGRVVTGQQAVELGLVDAIGYFDDAVAKAAELGGISGEPRVVELAPQGGLLNLLYGYQAHAQQAVPDVSDLLRSLEKPVLEYRFASP